MLRPSPSRPPGEPASRERIRGQSLVELALILPVMLLMLLVALDFGRIYLGYVNLQQMARVAANFAAEHAGSWDATPDAADQATFQQMIANDARAINCALPTDGAGTVHVPDPAFPDGFDLGDRTQVQITCNFSLLTPIISKVVGGQILVGGSATFPIKEGVVASVPGGLSVPAARPVADFVGSPTTGFQPLSVTFTDVSTQGPTSWQWSFGTGGPAFTKGPHTRVYSCPAGSLPGTTCTFDVSLQVGNTGGFDTASRSAYITVTVPPSSGPVAEFSGSPRSGVEGMTVTFAAAAPPTGLTYSNYEWDLDGNGSFERTGAALTSPTQTYTIAGSYAITLRVTATGGTQNAQTKANFILVADKICTVPDFAGVRKNSAQARWSAAGFTTTVNLGAGTGNYLINSQTLTGGTIDPEPNGCASVITVGP